MELFMLILTLMVYLVDLPLNISDCIWGYMCLNVIGTCILDPRLINLGGLDEVNVGNTAITKPHFIMEATWWDSNIVLGFASSMLNPKLESFLSLRLRYSLVAVSSKQKWRNLILSSPVFYWISMLPHLSERPSMKKYILRDIGTMLWQYRVC